MLTPLVVPESRSKRVTATYIVRSNDSSKKMAIILDTATSQLKTRLPNVTVGSGFYNLPKREQYNYYARVIKTSHYVESAIIWSQLVSSVVDIAIMQFFWKDYSIRDFLDILLADQTSKIIKTLVNYRCFDYDCQGSLDIISHSGTMLVKKKKNILSEIGGVIKHVEKIFRLVMLKAHASDVMMIAFDFFVGIVNSITRMITFDDDIDDIIVQNFKTEAEEITVPKFEIDNNLKFSSGAVECLRTRVKTKVEKINSLLDPLAAEENRLRSNRNRTEYEIERLYDIEEERKQIVHDNSFNIMETLKEVLSGTMTDIGKSIINVFTQPAPEQPNKSDNTRPIKDPVKTVVVTERKPTLVHIDEECTEFN